MKPTFLINSFPNDDVKRVLTLYGGIQNNRSGESTSPLIYVLLWEIDVEKNCLKKDQFIISTILLDQLYKAKIGSIWEGQKYISQNFNFSSNIHSLYLNFSLSLKKPSIIKLENLIKTNMEYINFSENKVINDFLKEDSTLFKVFSKTNYCSLLSMNGIKIFVCPIVLLQSFFSKKSSIKEELLTYNLDKIINKYFHLTPDSLNSYNYEIREPYKGIGKTSIFFLESIIYNKKIQKIISKLQISLEDIEFPTGCKYSKLRYPIITPPYLNNLSLKASGIWIKEDECFLVTKIGSSCSTDSIFYNYKYIDHSLFG